MLAWSSGTVRALVPETKKPVSEGMTGFLFIWLPELGSNQRPKD